MIFSLVQDFAAALAAMPEAHPRRRALELLDKALRRDLFFIAHHSGDYPQALFQCLWNTGWWHDCAHAKVHYVEPKDGWPKTGAPWEQSGVKLCELLER